MINPQKNEIMKFFRLTIVSVFLLFFIQPAWSMHIADGYLPASWCLVWWGMMLAVVAMGLQLLRKRINHDPQLKYMLGMAGAFVFVMSALKLPSVTGSSSHLCGTALGTLLIGPLFMSVIGVVVLLFQALLLAHGGVTTLGANAFALSVGGPLVTFGVFQLLKRFHAGVMTSVFIASSAGCLATYVITSFQLAIAFPGAGGWWVSMKAFSLLFAYTQLPLAFIEGVITLYVFNVVQSHRAPLGSASIVSYPHQP
jgi:cobalt/nickel transport system permease protein